MLKTNSWIELAEYSSLGGLVFGIITTAITKQLLYSFTPLTFALFLNSLSLQKYKTQLKEQNQQISNIIQEESKKITNFVKI